MIIIATDDLYQWPHDIIAGNSLPQLVVFINCLLVDEPAVVVVREYTSVLISAQTTHTHRYSYSTR